MLTMLGETDHVQRHWTETMSENGCESLIVTWAELKAMGEAFMLVDVIRQEEKVFTSDTDITNLFWSWYTQYMHFVRVLHVVGNTSHTLSVIRV